MQDDLKPSNNWCVGTPSEPTKLSVTWWQKTRCLAGVHKWISLTSEYPFTVRAECEHCGKEKEWFYGP
jgi:hypothetical protein